MKIERALKARDRLRVRIADIYSSAKFGGMTSQEINAAIASAKADCPKGTPEWVYSFCDGYSTALRNELYRDYLIFGGFIDGEFYGTDCNDSSYYAKRGIDALDWHKLVEREGHYWKIETPLRGGYYNRGAYRPYFIEESE